MHNEIELPNSKYINIDLGLKYLDGNKKLYLKILNSFLTRYENLEVALLNDNDLKATMHTIKGLASTLGMEQLSSLATELNELKTDALLFEFSETLSLIIEDLNKSHLK